jgi:hypothetical protein
MCVCACVCVCVFAGAPSRGREPTLLTRQVWLEAVGDLRSGSGDLAHVASRLQRVVAAGVGHPALLCGLGDVYQRLGQPDAAVVLLSDVRPCTTPEGGVGGGAPPSCTALRKPALVP